MRRAAPCATNAVKSARTSPSKARRKPGVTGFTPYRIRQKRCTHCGECIKVCPEKAVVIVEKDREADAKEPVRTLTCTCDVSGKATGHVPACSIHDMAGAGK